LTTAFISKTIIVYRPQTTYFKLTCRASDCQDFINTELLHRSPSKCRASLFYTGRGFIPSRSSEGLHPDIQDKARVFRSRLGITAENAEVLRSLIEQAALEGEVVQQAVTEFGQQFKVDWTIPKREGTQLRTIWEVGLINPNPRLISAFIK
jgi:hypothetical protein